MPTASVADLRRSLPVLALTAVAALAAGCASGAAPEAAEDTSAGEGAADPSAAVGSAPLSGALGFRSVLDTREADGTDSHADDAEAGDADLIGEIGLQPVDPDQQQRLLAGLRCADIDPEADPDPDKPLVTCDREGAQVYLLAPAMITEDGVAGAEGFFVPEQDENIVQLELTDQASQVWSDCTRENALELGGDGQQVGITVGPVVASAPQIVGHTPVGTATSITGGFTLPEARRLAETLTGR